MSELRKWSLYHYVPRTRHLSACLFHISASGAIIAAAIANHRRLSQQNPYKTHVSLVELGRISRHFIVHFKKIPTKKVPQVQALYRSCTVCSCMVQYRDFHVFTIPCHIGDRGWLLSTLPARRVHLCCIAHKTRKKNFEHFSLNIIETGVW